MIDGETLAVALGARASSGAMVDPGEAGETASTAPADGVGAGTD
jgi:hypothetical protein